MKPRNILYALCLLTAGTGFAAAGSPKKVKADKYGVRRSAPVELLSGKRQAGGRVTFKCRIVRDGSKCMMFAKILKNDSALHLVRPGIRFMLANGDTVVLEPEREAACCSNWADGRWYNASFTLRESDVERLGSTAIRSVSIPFYGGEISRHTASGKEKALAELLQSVGED